MPKRLVIFCDGTWNEPTTRGTNVFRMLQATDFSDKKGVPQIAHYVAGVGTRTKFERVIGGAFGFGVSNNIKDAYSFIVSNYNEGDEIFLFGFSRGAYTARSIAGFIHNMGILGRCNLSHVTEAYDHYKDKSPSWRPDGADALAFRKRYCYAGPTRIRFLGVWDTVGALGAPYGELIGRLLDKVFNTGFHSVTLSSSVDAAYHAMAADERRWPFRPTNMALTDYHRQRNAENVKDPNGGFLLYDERWFPGVHSNVGGGYDKCGLSDYALQWMATCAQQNGLAMQNFADVCLSETRPFGPDPAQPLEDSQTLGYRLATVLLVKIPALFGFKSVYPTSDQELAAHITWTGDYIRPIPRDADITAVTEKMGIDATYRPVNIEAPAAAPPTASTRELQDHE